MEVNIELPKGTEVRFTKEWLRGAGEKEAKRLEGRAGTISGYRLQIGIGVPRPIVTLPKFGRFKEQRLFEVEWNSIELA